MLPEQIDRQTGEFLNLLCHIKRPKRILELGTGEGYSTTFLNYDGKVQIDTIEINDDRYDEAQRNLSKYSNINIIHGNAIDLIPNLQSLDIPSLDGRDKERLNAPSTPSPKPLPAGRPPEAVRRAGRQVSHQRRGKMSYDLIFLDLGPKRLYKSAFETMVKSKILSDNFLLITDNVISHKEKLQDFFNVITNPPYLTFVVPIEKGVSVTIPKLA